jgi:hypothetical protein
LLGLLLVSAGLIVSAAHHGGIIVYEHGIGVRESETPAGANEPVMSTTAPTGFRGLAGKVAVLAPPLQTHVFVAGVAISLSLLTIGLSSRVMIERMALARSRAPRGDVDAIARAIEDPPAEPERALRLTTRCAPVALAACVFGLIAASVGMWFLAYDADAWTAEALRQQIVDNSMNPGGITSRRAAHVAGGMAIIVLPLALLATSRWLPRLRLVWTAVSVLLVFVVAAQVWLGVLMMFDESRVLGPITGWSR